MKHEEELEIFKKSITAMCKWISEDEEIENDEKYEMLTILLTHTIHFFMYNFKKNLPALFNLVEDCYSHYEEIYNLMGDN